MTDREPETLVPGTTISGYRIENELGRGAMAVVYRAIQLNLDRPVALKILTYELAHNEEFVGRFFNEARAAAALSHANIIQAYDAGVAEGGIHFFAMEFVEGHTLLDRIREHGPIPVVEGISIALDIAEALNYGWQRQQLTHGDIKPENIMLNKEGETKLADFGLAKVAEHDFEGSEIMLTPLYASPEAIQGKQKSRDCRGDIYSFGATLYHMLAGTPPFPGTRAQEVMQRHLTEPLMPLSQRRPGIPRDVSDFVTGLLAKDPDQRFQTWDTVVRKLRAIKRRLSEKRANVIFRPTAVKQSVSSSTKLKNVGEKTADAGARQTGLGKLTVALLFLAILVGLLAVVLLRPPPVVSDAASPPSPAVDASSPRVDEGPPPKQISEAVTREWEKLTSALDRQTDPEKALALLKEFGRLHADALPQDYARLEAQYQEALKWRNAAENASAQEKREWRFEKDKLAENLPPKPLPEPTLPEPTSPAKNVDTDTSAPQEEKTDVLDSYALFISELTQFAFAVGRSVEPLLKRGEEWLLLHPGQSDERDMVIFVANTVLPSIEACLPKLITRKDEIIGVRFPGRKYNNARLKDLSLSDVLLEEDTKHGKMVRSVSWSELDDPRYLLYLAKEVFGKPDTYLADAAPYLGLLLFTRQEKLWVAAIDALPQTAVRRQWERLWLDFSQGDEEGKAVRLWQEALEAYEQREPAECYRLLATLENTGTAAAFRHKDQIAELKNKCGARVPSVIAGALLLEARKNVSESPDKALTAIARVISLYGDAEFPEKGDIQGILGKALANFPAPNWVKRSAQLSPERSITPFVTANYLSPPCGSLLVLNAAKQEGERIASRVTRVMPVLSGLAALEFGDWHRAQALFETLPPRTETRLTGSLKLSYIYAQALIDWRFSASDPETSTYLKVMEELLTGKEEVVPGKRVVPALMLDYLLTTRELVKDPIKSLHWKTGLSQPDVRLAQRMMYGAISYLAEQEGPEATAAFIRELLDSNSGIIQSGSRDSTAQFLKGLLDHLEERKRFPAASVTIPVPGGEYLFRAIAAVLFTRIPLETDSADWLYKICETASDTFGVIGGTTLYDTILYRVASHLSQGDIASAIDDVEWGIGIQSTSLFPYYPRLCLLCSGLQMIDGRMLAGRETAERVTVSTVASGTERALAGLVDEKSDRNRIRAKIRKRHEARFWYTWLSAAERIGSDGVNEGPKAMAWFKDTTKVRSERMLVAALEEYLRRAAAQPRH